jgi:hypothetical protein
MVAGFKSERWPVSSRNPGRLQVGTPGRIKSESASKGLPTLRDAFVGWKKEGTRASTTAVGYEHALDRWEQLHKRKATDITEVDGTQCLLVYSDKVAGQPLKTVGSARTIPRIDHELTCAR